MSGTLDSFLRDLTVDGELYEPLDRQRIRCLACGHRCPIPDGAAGVCKVRFNRGGILRVPYGYTVGLQCDPVEKKPFFHVQPGARAFSFGMLGCDLHCGYCQNWITSQALRDPLAGAQPRKISPEQIVQSALAHRAALVVSTYNEPLITSEWAVAIFRLARKQGMRTGYVSNGNGTPKVLDYLEPWIDCFKVDLKCFDDRKYRSLGGRLDPILDTIRLLQAKGIWLEIVTLLVPGFNDSREELEALTRFIAGISADIPWHVTAFHADYRMTESDNTSVEDLARAARIGRESGLSFIYAGNLPGWVGSLENTYCRGCEALLVERCGYQILRCLVTDKGTCPRCHQAVPGIWSAGYSP